MEEAEPAEDVEDCGCVNVGAADMEGKGGNITGMGAGSPSTSLTLPPPPPPLTLDGMVDLRRTRLRFRSITNQDDAWLKW